MQVLITSTRIELVQQGSVLPLIGADMLSAKYAESTVKQPVIGDGDLSIFIRLQYQEEPVEIPLRAVRNQPRWTNDQEGAQQALLDILPVMRSPNMSGSGGIFQLTGSVLAGPGAGVVPSVLSNTGVVPGSYNNPVVIVNAEGRITSIVSTPPSGGDVSGPGSAGDENIVLFNGTSGKNIKDSGITLAQVVTTDGNPSGVSPISSGAGVSPIELRRFTDSLAIKAQANTGSVSFHLLFSALNKVFIGDALGDPVEADVATTSAANAIVRALATGKIDTSFLPDSILGQLEYQGSWDAATNTPAIPAASSANKGWYYIASTAVASSHGYPNVPAVDFAIGDWLVSNGTSWDKIDNTDAVPSVFGRVGAIVAAFGDYSSTLISNLSAVAGASVTDALNALNTLVAAKQDLDATLTALAALNSTPGLLEQTGADAFTKRAIGVAASTSIPTRGDADARYLTPFAHTQLPPWTVGTQDNSTTTLVDVTDTEFTIPSPGLYEVEYRITYNANATTTGAGFAIRNTVGGTLDYNTVEAGMDTQSGDRSTIRGGVSTDVAVASSRVTSGNTAVVRANLIFNAASAIRLQFRSEIAATITITNVVGFIRRKS